MKENAHNLYNFEINKIASGAGIFFLGSVIGSILKYIFEVSVARNIGAHLFGIFFLGLAIFKIAERISSVGMHVGVLRFVPLFRSQRDKKRMKGIILLALLIAGFAGLIVALLIFLASPFLSVGVFKQDKLTLVSRFFAVGVPLSVLTLILTTSIQALQLIKYKVYVRELLEPSLRLSLAVLFFVMGMKLYGAIFAYLISLVSGLLLSIHFLRKVFPEFTSRQLKPVFEPYQLFSFSWPLFFVAFFNIIVLWTDTIMIGLLKSSYDVGIYSAAQRTALLGTFILFSFNAIFAPIISELHHKAELEKLSYLFKMITKWIFTFSLPIFLFLMFFSETILHIFGREFMKGAPCLRILCIGQLISAGVGSVGIMLTMTGHPKISLVNTVSVFFMNVFLNFILIPPYGISGAAIATAISLGTINIIRLLEVYKISGLHPYRLDFLKPVIAGFVAILGLRGFSFLVDLKSNIFIQLGAGVGFFSVVYFLVLCFLGLQKEERSVIEAVKRKLHV